MSTRAQIGFYASENAPIESEGKVFVYKHHDGYPEGVLPALVPFARSFHKYHGLRDTAYATARCLVALAAVREADWQRCRDAGAPWAQDEEPDYDGLGVGTALYTDIEFFYHVSPTRIGVYAVSEDDERDDGENPAEFRLATSVALAPPEPQ